MPFSKASRRVMPRRDSQRVESRAISNWLDWKLSQRTFPIPKVQDSGNICSLRSQNCCRLITVCLFFFAFWVRDYPALVPPSYVGCMGWEGCRLSSFTDAVAPAPGWAWCHAKNGPMGIFCREIEFFFPHGEMKWINICDQKKAQVVATIQTSHSYLLIVGRVNVMLDYMQMTMKWLVVCLK